MTKMEANFSHLSLSLLVFILASSLCSARPSSHHLSRTSSNSTFVRTRADMIMKFLNLHPASPVNVRADESIDTTCSEPVGKIIERRLQFPNLVSTAEELGHHAGYYKLPRYIDARLFYFFFESRSNKSDPVVLWLTGGPGCGSEIALFYENGPFHVADNLTLTPNEHGWDKASNILFIDQPVGTGFSYISDNEQIPSNETGVSNDLYDFLQAFFKKHPDYAQNDFYIAGESYAGHYIPAFAARLQKGNKAKEGVHVNLKGFAIGNGFTDPAVQYAFYADYALQMKIIDRRQYESMNRFIPDCQDKIKTCERDGGASCATAYYTCEGIFAGIMNIAGAINYYDIRKKCVGELCYDLSNVEKYLRQKSVKDALGVGRMDYVSCSTVVYNAMMNDEMKNFAAGIPALLEDGIKMLVYAGEYDLICNWIGNVRWVERMVWPGQKEFLQSSFVPYTVEGEKAGEQRSHGAVTFIKVHNAGHMVPMDQPKVSLQMLKDWMQEKFTVQNCVQGLNSEEARVN